ncbi:MAG: hypothetical protein ACD_22C00106G0001 [uncultured bacterium]|nr:MAG: hypothetical protein ACD_22C00106G0001 [uncultured bacterium]
MQLQNIQHHVQLNSRGSFLVKAIIILGLLLVAGIVVYKYLATEAQLPSVTNDSTVYPSAFQKLLVDNCIGGTTAMRSERIDIAKTPFTVSDALKAKYKADSQFSCVLTPDKTSGSGAISMQTNSGAWDNTEILMGDIYSGVFGMEGHFLDFEKEVKENKQTVIYDKDGVKVVTRLMFAGPHCAGEKGTLVFELRIFKQLGDYRVAGSAHYSMAENPTRTALVKQHGSLLNIAGAPSGDYCVDDYAGYEKAVLNTFAPSYEEAIPAIKQTVDALLEDINGVGIRN